LPTSMLVEVRGPIEGVPGRRAPAVSGPPRPQPARTLAQDLLHQPLERLNKEIQRRSRVVGIFPNPAPRPGAPRRPAPQRHPAPLPARALACRLSPYATRSPSTSRNGQLLVVLAMTGRSRSAPASATASMNCPAFESPKR